MNVPTQAMITYAVAAWDRRFEGGWWDNVDEAKKAIGEVKSGIHDVFVSDAEDMDSTSYDFATAVFPFVASFIDWRAVEAALDTWCDEKEKEHKNA